MGEQFVTSRRRSILTLVGDTSPGVHDMLIAACDPARYRTLGIEQHASCADYLRNAMAQIGMTIGSVPQPVNVFMNIPIGVNGDLQWLGRPQPGAGDAVTFEAVLDCVVVVSACPMDVNSINGERPTPLAIEIDRPNSASPERI